MEGLKFRKLYASEIDCRVSTVTQKGCSILLYKDARVDQRLLDETVGPYNWQRNHEVINGNLFCNVGVYVERADGYGEWVWKQDVGKESYTEKEKGQASDAFKRACFNWGIGRELYTAPFIWIGADDVNIQMKNGKPTTYDRFRLEAIGYVGDSISYLKISKGNGKAKETVYENGDPDTIYTANSNLVDSEEPEEAKEEAEDRAKTEQVAGQTISDEKAAALTDWCINNKVNGAKICALYDKEKFTDLTEGQFAYIVKHQEEVIEKCK